MYDEMLAEGRSTGTGGQAINLPLIASSDETGTSKSLRASTDLKIKIKDKVEKEVMRGKK